MCIDDVRFGVRDRAANGNIVRCVWRLCNWMPCRVRAALRRAVHVQEALRTSFLENLAYPLGIERFAACEQMLQVPEHGWVFSGKLVQQSGGDKQRSDAL